MKEGLCKRCNTQGLLVEDSNLCVDCYSKIVDKRLEEDERKSDRKHVLRKRNLDRATSVLEAVDRGLWESQFFSRKKKAEKLLLEIIMRRVSFSFMRGDKFKVISGQLVLDLRSLKQVNESAAKFVRVKFHKSPKWYTYELNKAIKLMTVAPDNDRQVIKF